MKLKYFAGDGLTGPLKYEGPRSRNPLSFKFYDPQRVVLGKKMVDHMRPAVPYWHGLRGTGGDQFGPGTHRLSWPMQPKNTKDVLKILDAAFELAWILGVPYLCFHDTDLIQATNTLGEANAALDAAVDGFVARSADTGIGCLWTTQNAFSDPRYMHGAGTAVSSDVFAYAGAQIKKALEIGLKLKAANHVFWDGRGGASNYMLRDLKRDLAHKGRLLHMAVAYAAKIGFNGQFLIEPKPKEPTTVQIDSTVAACIEFLRHEGLDGVFKMNVEDNHATLAGNPFDFELYYAAARGMLGSVDANQGEPTLGWDTDHLPTCPRRSAKAWLPILGMGGFTTGGLNFDAKCRRESVDPIDRVYAYALGLDTYAAGLLVAEKVIERGELAGRKETLYRGWDNDLGRKIEGGTATLEDCEAHILGQNGVTGQQPSGREELTEGLFTAAMAEAFAAL